jgi:hypothetical protein
MATTSRLSATRRGPRTETELAEPKGESGQDAKALDDVFDLELAEPAETAQLGS